MTDKKISELTSITGANVSDANDVLPIVDTSVATTKKITRAELFKSVSSVDINGGTIDGTVIGGSTPAAISGTTGTFSGNVGIGTSSPADKLSLEVGAANQGLSIYYSGVEVASFRSDTGNATLNANNASLKFATGGSERMRIDASGNVGIGTSSPTATLDVAGSVIIRNSNAINELTFSGAEYTNIYSGTASGFDIGITSSGGSSYLRFLTENTERMRIDASGNLLLAGTGTPTSSAGNLVLYNGTAPTGNAANGVILYAEDVSASSELKVRDEAGNVTTLSPHNFDLIPEGPSEDMAWSYYSERDGKRINVDMLKAIRLLEQITGEKLVHMA